MGRVCDLKFSSRRALYSHVRFSRGGTHGTRSLAYTMVLTSQCPWCCTVFSSRLAAQHHTFKMFETGVCNIDVSPVDYKVDQVSCVCPACGDVFPELCELQWHVRNHVNRPCVTIAIPSSLALSHPPTTTNEKTSEATLALLHPKTANLLSRI